jgi:hypothetical protein
MQQEPEVQERAAQSYAGIPVAVTMETFPAAADTGFPELFGWLAEHGVPPAGAPFIRYYVIDMDAELEIELAVPVDEPVRESAGSVPASCRPAAT